MKDGSAHIELHRSDARSLWAAVDRADYERLVKERWHAVVRRHAVYARGSIKVDGKWRSVLMHRYILDAPSDMLVDHIDGDGINNRRANLRLATPTQNSRNNRSDRGASTHKGVIWVKAEQRWAAAIRVDGRRRYLGRYKNEIDAALAYDAAAREAFGEFACLNFPTLGVS